MSIKEKAELMLMCGALHDIAEKCKDAGSGAQIKALQLKIEGMIKDQKA